MSKKLDEELAEAIGKDDAPGVVKPAREVRDANPPRKKNLGLLLSLLAMVGALTVLFLLVLKPAAVYSVPVDKLMSEKAAYMGRKVRIEGELVPGTLQRRDRPCEYRFTIHTEQAQLPVSYPQCAIPDGFRDVPTGGVTVTIEGALRPQGDFEATLVMAKCSSKYDPAKHTMDGEPKALPVN
jgi:cytochrome c-type biogenesis protein CcmE